MVVYSRIGISDLLNVFKCRFLLYIISKFEELLDVRDNLKLPIMYYVVTKHTKCCFYIKHNDDLYLLTIKSVDLEQKQD